MSRVAALWGSWDRRSPRSIGAPQGASFAGVGLIPELPDARVSVEVAWGADLTADPDTYPWVDVTADVRTDPGISTKLGRSDESSTSNPAELRLVFDNTREDYSRGPRSQWYPNIRPNTPIRVRIDTGTGARTIYQGGIASYTPGWDSEQGDIPTVSITAAGTLRRLDQGAEAVISPIRRFIQNQASVTAYWACEVGDRATSIPNEFGGGYITWTGTADLASFADIPASLDLPTTNASALYRAVVDPYTVTTDNTQSVRMMFMLPSGGVTNNGVLFSCIMTGGTVSRIDLVYQTGSILRANVYSNTGATICSDVAVFGIDGTPGALSLEFAQSGGNVFVAIKFLGLGASNYGTTGGASGAGTLGTVGEVWIDPYQVVDGLGFGHLSVLTVGSAVDPLTEGVLQINGYDGEGITSGRLTRICSENGIRFQLYGGTSSAATPNDYAGPQPIATVLDILHQCEDVERGVLWDGLTAGLAYTTRRRRESAAPAFTINAGDLELAPPFEPTDDDQRLRNRWTVNRTDGAEFTISDDTGPLGTEAVGIYADSMEVNSNEDWAARSLADWLVHQGTTEGYRYPSVTVDLRATPQFAEAIVDLFPGARVDITDIATALDGAGADDVSLVVESIAHDISDMRWTVTLTCSPFDPWAVALVAGESGDLGEFAERLDTNTTVTTGGTLLAGATSFQVNVTDGPFWTTNADDYPLDLSVGGWEVNVTACAGASNPQTFTCAPLPDNIADGSAVALWDTPALGL